MTSSTTGVFTTRKASSWTPSAWQGALSDLPFETPVPIALRVTGTIPNDLHGILYKAGPAKFHAPNGQAYAHWLEGDGAVIRLEIQPADGGMVKFSSRLVQTKSYQADQAAGCVTTRGTFGTKKTDGSPNMFDVNLKNPANTNAVRLGNDRVLALSEVGLPYALDPNTLETRGIVEKLVVGDDVASSSSYVEGSSAATTGLPRLDKLLGFGHAMSAHVRFVTTTLDSNDGVDNDDDSNPTERQRHRHLIMVGMQQHAVTGDTLVDLWELDPRTGRAVIPNKGNPSNNRIILEDTGFPPHDFICTTKHAIWITCPAGGNLIPFLLGQKGPAECLSFRANATSTLHVAPLRRIGNDCNVKRFSLGVPVHPVHFGCAWENSSCNGETVIYFSGYNPETMKTTMARGDSLLGSWAAIRSGDFSGVQPQSLLKVTLSSSDSNNQVVSVATIADDWIEHIDFVKCHPDFEGQECRYLYGTVSTPPKMDEPSGVAPPQTICIVDLKEERVVDSWFAGLDNILDDFIMVPKRGCKGERDAWILAPYFNGDNKTTSFLVLDAKDLSKGAVAEAHLEDHHIPWGLHGTWWEL